MDWIISLKMECALFSLLLFVTLPGVFALEFTIQSKVCSADLIAYSNSFDVELFYINGNQVDRSVFCKALQFHYESHCIFKGYFGSDYCSLDFSLAAELPFKSGRKILQKVGEEPKPHDGSPPIDPRKNKNDPKSLSTPKEVGLVGAGFFVLSCALLCPCFYKKRKATTDTVLSKDINSMDPVSSFEVTSASDKIPPSPLRVPPSPRFSMSPQLRRVKSVHLNMSQVIKATRNFSPTLQIGEGGFGTVFKAKLEDDQVVAIKRAKKWHHPSSSGWWGLWQMRKSD